MVLIFKGAGHRRFRGSDKPLLSQKPRETVGTKPPTLPAGFWKGRGRFDPKLGDLRHRLQKQDSSDLWGRSQRKRRTCQQSSILGSLMVVILQGHRGMWWAASKLTLNLAVLSLPFPETPPLQPF